MRQIRASERSSCLLRRVVMTSRDPSCAHQLRLGAVTLCMHRCPDPIEAGARDIDALHDLAAKFSREAAHPLLRFGDLEGPAAVFAIRGLVGHRRRAVPLGGIVNLGVDVQLTSFFVLLSRRLECLTRLGLTGARRCPSFRRW